MARELEQPALAAIFGQRLERGGEAAVQQRTPRAREPHEYGFSYEGVGEAVATGHPALVHQPRPDRGVQVAGQLVVAGLAGGGDVREQEILAGHRRDLHGAADAIRQPDQPPIDHRAHTVRDLGAGRRDQLGGRHLGVGLHQMARELLQEQRIAGGAPSQSRRELGRRLRTKPRRGQLTGLLLGKAGERERFEAPLTPQVAQQGLQRGRGADALIAQRPGDQQRRPPDRPKHVPQHLQRRRVGPVQVLDDQEKRGSLCGLRDGGGHGLKQAVAGVLRRAFGHTGSGAQLGQQAGELG